MISEFGNTFMIIYAATTDVIYHICAIFVRTYTQRLLISESEIKSLMYIYISTSVFFELDQSDAGLCIFLLITMIPTYYILF